MQLQENGFDSGKANSDQGQSNMNQPSQQQPAHPTGMYNMMDEEEELARRLEEGGRGTDHEMFRESLPHIITNFFQNPDNRAKMEPDEEDDIPNSELHS